MMEIRTILRGENTSFAACPARTAEDDAAAGRRTAADRVDLSRQWAEQLEDQRKQLLALMSQPAGQNKKKRSDGLLDMLDGIKEGNEEADAMTKQLKVKMKCLEIARRIMQGKKVPIKDERYLMENDPKGYQLAIVMRTPPKKDEKECKSVLDDEDEQSGETSGSEEAAPAETGEPAVSSGGDSSE